MNTLTRGVIVGALLSTTATLGLAQEANDLFLGEIRIESAQAQEVLGNEAIEASRIERRNPATMADMFTGETSITASGGAPIAQKVFVNGIEESLLAVTIDGARQNKSAFHHTGNVLIDPALVKSVEVSAGLAPADAGPNALAGGIAYTTKDARDMLAPGDNFGGRLSFTATDNGEGRRGSLTLFGMQGGFEYLLHGTRQTGVSYSDGTGTIIRGTEADLTDYVAKFAYTSDTGKRLSFATSRTSDTGQRLAQAGPGGILFTRPDFAGVARCPSVLTDALARRTSYTLTFSDEAPEGQFAPTAQLSYNEQEIDASGVYGINKSLSGVVKNTFTIGNGTIVAGLDFFRESAEGQGRGPGPFGRSGKEEMRNIGLFAQVRQDIGERVSLSYGARYDLQSFDAANGQTFEDNGASVNASIDLKLSDTLTLNAGAASSWGGYELGEAALINFGAPWSYNGFTASRATAYRIGLRYDNGPWAISGAYFDTRVDDINAVLPRRGNRGATSDLQSRGFDASLRYTADQGFFGLNYTYADVTIDKKAAGSTAYYIGRPQGHLFGLEAAYDINDQFRVGGSAEIALKNDKAAVVLPGYEVFNLYTEYKPRNVKGLTVRLDVRNVFNETYARRSSDGIDSARVVALTEPGRTIALTANFDF